MSASPAANVAVTYQTVHTRILTLAESLSDEALRWRPSPRSHSVAFHLWHVARWADHLQAAIPGMTTELGQRLGPGVEVWEAERLAARWSLGTGSLGFAQTGMDLPDEQALALVFPPKETLLDYARRAFAAAERALGAVDDEQLQAQEQPQPMTEAIFAPGTVGGVILTHIRHDAFHLGAMDYARGLWRETQEGNATP
jgi:uncharacterized damage-inducible protein DinB